GRVGRGRDEGVSDGIGIGLLAAGRQPAWPLAVPQRVLPGPGGHDRDGEPGARRRPAPAPAVPLPGVRAGAGVPGVGPDGFRIPSLTGPVRPARGTQAPTCPPYLEVVGRPG